MNESERKEVEALLPWYATGALSARETQRVKSALESDTELARNYELAREEMGATIHLNETLGAPSSRLLVELNAKIDAEPARPVTTARLRDRIGEFLARLTPRTLAWSTALALLLILLQGGLIVGLILENKMGGVYQTASVPGEATGGSFAFIRFQPQASAEDITGFLQTNRLTVVEGPVAGGLYRVRIAPTALSQAEAADLVKKLQDDKIVGFIGVAQ